uniref:Uncharacterized protein n=1 Tax=Ditylenchus dipsaci TaxID=166011 RepID=A0A915CXD1_9BILA
MSFQHSSFFFVPSYKAVFGLLSLIKLLLSSDASLCNSWFLVVAVGIAFQLGFSKWSNEEVVAPAVSSASKHSSKPSSDVDTANSPSYATSPRGSPSKEKTDVDTAKSPVYEATPVKEGENEQQPSNDVNTATYPKIEEDKQPSTANSLSSASVSIGASDDDKKAKKMKKKHKKGHSKQKKSKGNKGSKKRDKTGSSSSSNVGKGQ